MVRGAVRRLKRDGGSRGRDGAGRLDELRVLLVVNAVLGFFAGAALTYHAWRAESPAARVTRVVLAMAAFYVGGVYGAALVEYVPLGLLGSIYLRPVLSILLFGLALLPWVDRQEPVERMEKALREAERALTDLSAEKDRLVTEWKRQHELLSSELVNARLEIAGLRDRLDGLERERDDERQRDRRLVVAVGDDDALDVDLAALRAVKTRTGLSFMRLKPATKVGLKRLLDRQRMAGTPIRWLQLSMHMGHEGAQFADGVADGVWLSEQLAGVEVLMLAGCSSDFVGDDLGVVPHVVSVMEDVGMRDAAMLSEAFWGEMALGATPRDALEEALDRTPPAVAEFVQLHEFRA